MENAAQCSGSHFQTVKRLVILYMQTCRWKHFSTISCIIISIWICLSAQCAWCIDPNCCAVSCPPVCFCHVLFVHACVDCPTMCEGAGKVSKVSREGDKLDKGLSFVPSLFSLTSLTHTVIPKASTKRQSKLARATALRPLKLGRIVVCVCVWACAYAQERLVQLINLTLSWLLFHSLICVKWYCTKAVTGRVPPSDEGRHLMDWKQITSDDSFWLRTFIIFNWVM